MKYDNDEIVHKKIGDFEYLQFKALLKYEDEIVHCFPLRRGGKSKGSFESLNLGVGTGDDMDLVRANYKIVCDNLHMNYDNIFEAYQEHRNNVVFVDKDMIGTICEADLDKKVHADGSITNIAGIPLVAKCADCMTIIIYDPIKKVIAAVHSGWKSTLKRIINVALQKMINEYGCNKDTMIVCVGPSICKECFEVKDDVKVMFENTFEDKYISKKDDEHWLIDLVSILKEDILSNGILEENIHLSGICNTHNFEDFFSYRKTPKGDITGIMGHFIMLK